MGNGPKISNIDKVITDPILAQAWVEPEKAIMNRITMNMGGAIATATLVKHGDSARAAIETGEAPTGNVAMAVTADSLHLLPAEMGLMSPKVKGVWLTIPRSEVASLEIGDGKLNLPVILTLSDGQQLQWTIHRTRRGWVDGVIQALQG